MREFGRGLQVEGREHLPQPNEAAVYVANHQSFMVRGLQILVPTRVLLRCPGTHRVAKVTFPQGGLCRTSTACSI